MEWKSNKKAIRVINTKIGNKIEFERRGRKLEGLVTNVRENTVIVELSKEGIDFLELENEFTVVNHSNYKII